MDPRFLFTSEQDMVKNLWYQMGNAKFRRYAGLTFIVLDYKIVNWISSHKSDLEMDLISPRSWICCRDNKDHCWEGNNL